MDNTENKDEDKNAGREAEAENRAELARKKYLYRTLIVKGGARVKNSGSTRRLIGPDCAYHLYSYMKKEQPDEDSEPGQDR